MPDSLALSFARRDVDVAGDAIIAFRLANMRRKIPARLIARLNAANARVVALYAAAALSN